MRNRLFNWVKTGESTYRQKAKQSSEISVAGITQQIKKGDLGGAFKLSSNPKEALLQRQDLLLSNEGVYGSNLWIDKDSSLSGNIKVPRNGLFINSNVQVEPNGQSAILNDSVLHNSNLKTNKNVQLFVTDKTLLDNVNLDAKSKTPKNAIYQHSSLSNTNHDLQNSDLLIKDSNLVNVNTKDNCNLNKIDALFDKAKLLDNANYTNEDLNTKKKETAKEIDQIEL